jgi:hypothetical protein
MYVWGPHHRMDSALAATKDRLIPTILVLAGLVFLLLSVTGRLAGRIVVAPERQRWAAMIGGGVLAIGIALHVVPQTRLISRGTEEAPTSRPSTPQTKDQRPQPSEVSPRTPPSTPESSVQALTEEKEPNSDMSTATVITEGTTVRGSIATDQDQDFFRVNPSGYKTRVLVRIHSPSNFMLFVIVYDHVEKMLAMYPATVLQPATLSFESMPGSPYYIVVRSPGSGQRGSYELEVRKE